MRKGFILIAACIVAFVLIECVVRFVLRFPTEAVMHTMTNCSDRPLTEKLYLPHSRYYSIENGYHVYHRNNLGLTGIDVKVGKQYKYVYFLGNSFAEAYQVQPERIAASLLQKGLPPTYQVINIGRRNQDPIDQYYRLQYFQKQYPASWIVLVIDNFNTSWLARHPKDITLANTNNYCISTNRTNQFLDDLRNNLSMCELFVKGFSASKFDSNRTKKSQGSIQNPDEIFYEVPTQLQKVINSLSDDTMQRLIICSFSKNQSQLSVLQSYCEVKHIPLLLLTALQDSRYRIEGDGLLNEEGNAYLAARILESLKTYARL